MDQALADAEDAEDAAAIEDWNIQRAAGQAITIPHDEVRRRLGLDNGQTPEQPDSLTSSLLGDLRQIG